MQIVTDSERQIRNRLSPLGQDGIDLSNVIVSDMDPTGIDLTGAADDHADIDITKRRGRHGKLVNIGIRAASTPAVITAAQHADACSCTCGHYPHGFDELPPIEARGAGKVRYHKTPPSLAIFSD